MRRAAAGLLTLIAASCQSPAPRSSGANVPTAATIGEPTRVAIAGRAQARAAYTAYVLNLLDLQLSFLETLPRGWFPETPEFEAGLREVEAVSGIPRTGRDLAAFGRDARTWRDWYVQRRASLSPAEAHELDALFGRLEGTSPFLQSAEFRDVVRSAGRLTGRAPSWDSSERYASWDAFERDRAAWRIWLHENAGRLEWDVASQRLVLGRGLPVTP